ncbi:ankyrin repeat-containing domain protein [Tuber brumale]|nr:ankyrin repeat-containing domain protein [Tuber brumale]
MLLERGDVNPDRADTAYGQTPLSLAAVGGHEGIVKMLLERGDVNPNQADTKHGRTPLSWAAENGHEGIVKMLLERRDVSTATTDSANQTPLSRALTKGHDRILRMLLERDGANFDTADRVGYPPRPPLGIGASVLGMPSSGDNLNIGTTDINAQQAHLSADPNERKPVSGPEECLSKPADSDLPSTEQSRLPPMRPHKLLAPSQESRHPTQQHSNDSPTRGRPVDRYFTIASFVCLLAFLVYILPSLLAEIFPLHK